MTPGGAAPDLRRDPLSGRLVVTAPGRAKRPGAFPKLEPPPEPDELGECPFCAGREDRTPPETLRLPPDGEWRVRVVPNLYPAFARQEVVVHSPEHVRSITELTDDALALVAEAWRRRAEGSDYVLALVNEGRIAGASLPHTHSQLVWLREPPPAVALEGAMEAVLDGQPVLEREGVAVICPAVSAEPYEMRIAPVDPEAGAFPSALLPVALQAAAAALRRLRVVEPDAPVNIWLHDGPWWHLHLVPRLTVAAGVELGAHIHVNPLPPEEAATRLRG